MGVGVIKNTRPLRRWLYFNGYSSVVYISKNITGVKTVMVYGNNVAQKEFFGAYVDKVIWTGSNIKGYAIRHIGQNLVFQVGNGSVSHAITLVNGVDNKNHFLVGVIDEDNEQMIGYVNGERVGTNTLYYEDAGEYHTNVGRSEYVNATKSFLYGYVYFVALYNRALSDAEISQMYNYVVNGQGKMIKDGLVLWLDGDSIDETNGVWRDKSPYHNDGKIYGAQVRGNVSDYDGVRQPRRWLYFDGVDDKVTVISEQINNIVGNYSILILYKVKNNDKVNNLWTKKLDGYTYEYQFYAYQQGIIIYTLDWKSSTTYCLNKNIYSNGTKLTFLALSRSETEGKIYLDGELKATQSLSCVNAKSSQPLQIGWQGAGGWYFNGNIYFFALYNRALSDDEIKQVYNYVMNRQGEMIKDGLVLWLDGDSIGNGIWYDKSGNGNHGTIYGAQVRGNYGHI